MPLTAWNVLSAWEQGLLLVLWAGWPPPAAGPGVRVRYAPSKGDTLSCGQEQGRRSAPGVGGQAPRPDGAAESSALTTQRAVPAPARARVEGTAWAGVAWVRAPRQALPSLCPDQGAGSSESPSRHPSPRLQPAVWAEEDKGSFLGSGRRPGSRQMAVRYTLS